MEAFPPRVESKEKPVELIDLYTEENLPLGRAVSRDQAHAEGLWHRTVHIYLTRSGSAGTEILVHVRSKNKKQYPGKRDPVFGGHIKSGQSDEEAALAELHEEAGIVPDPTRLIFHGAIKKDDEVNAPGDKEFNMLFSYELSAEEQSKVVLQEEEIESAEWISPDELFESLYASPEQWRPSPAEASASRALVFASRE